MIECHLWSVCLTENATVAQLVEQLIRNQQVAGSSPASSSMLAPESIIRGHRFGHCPDCRNDVTRSRLRRTIAVPSLRSLQVRPVAPKKRTPLRVFSFLGLRAGFGSVRPKIKRTGSPKKGAPAGRARGKSPANAAKKPRKAGRALQGFYDLSRGIRRQADAGRD